MVKAISPDEMRRRLKRVLEDEKARASKAGERPSFTAASIGKALGNKDHIRDFLVGNKESLGTAVVLETERMTGLPYGGLHLPKAVIGSFDPDIPEPPLPDDSDSSFDPDAARSSASFPADAIKELGSKAGLGAGQAISTTYVRGETEITTQDTVLDDYWRLPPPFVRSILHARVADLLVVECEGDSMIPTLSSGERVIVNTAHKKPSPDGLYAIRNQIDDVVVKRLELFGTDPARVRIISDNPKHAPQERGLDEIAIVGKVVLGLKLY